jgi:pSer/pThr/pTyr-binding forkhead associated (FHA) protein
VETMPGKETKIVEAVPVEEHTNWDGGGGGKLQALAVPLKKSDRNERGDRLTIGRTVENDVVVQHLSVSKNHAFIKEDAETGRLEIWDAGSSYGTTVNGELVRKGQPHVLEDRDTLVFAASVLATYFKAESFYDYMNLMAEAD